MTALCGDDPSTWKRAADYAFGDVARDTSRLTDVQIRDILRLSVEQGRVHMGEAAALKQAVILLNVVRRFDASRPSNAMAIFGVAWVAIDLAGILDDWESLAQIAKILEDLRAQNATAQRLWLDCCGLFARRPHRVTQKSLLLAAKHHMAEIKIAKERPFSIEIADVYPSLFRSILSGYYSVFNSRMEAGFPVSTQDSLYAEWKDALYAMESAGRTCARGSTSDFHAGKIRPRRGSLLR